MVLDIHTRIANRDLSPHRMDTKGRFGAIKAQTKNDDHPQLAIVASLAKLRQVVQQQAKLMQKQAEEAKEREKELARPQN